MSTNGRGNRWPAVTVGSATLGSIAIHWPRVFDRVSLWVQTSSEPGKLLEVDGDQVHGHARGEFDPREAYVAGGIQLEGQSLGDRLERRHGRGGREVRSGELNGGRT
jgi:hypothetical protein